MTAQSIKLQKRLALSSSKGFTLIELLVVIGILAVLLAITLIAINPARQFAQANNTRRASDVNAILNAVGQYSAEHHGDLTALNIPTAAPAVIGSNTAGGQVDFCPSIVPTYIAQMPVDPNATGAHWTSCADYDSQYTIIQDASGTGRVTVAAPGTQVPPATAIITVTR